MDLTKKRSRRPVSLACVFRLKPVSLALALSLLAAGSAGAAQEWGQRQFQEKFMKNGEQRPISLVQNAATTGVGNKPKHPWSSRTIDPAQATQGGQPAAAGTGEPRLSKVETKKGTAVLNFSDVQLKDFLGTISDLTGKNFILSPGVVGRTISIRTTKPIRQKDVFGIFETILEVNGLAAVRTGDYYTIVTAPTAKKRGLSLYTDKETSKIPRGDRMINLLVPIKFVAAADIVQIIKPTLSDGGNITHYQKGNTLIITDIASNVKKFLEIINELDVDLFNKMNVTLMPIKYVDAALLGSELMEVFKILGYDKNTSQLFVLPIERLNSLIVFSSNKELLASATEWINRFDTETSPDEKSVHIYKVKNDTASNIKTLLEQLFGGGKATKGLQGGTAPNTVNPARDGAMAGGDEGSLSPREDIDVFIYEPTNALIIRSSQRDYQYVLKLVKELDRPSKQVMIDALVAEIVLDDSTKYGLQWSALSGNTSIQQQTGAFGTSIEDPGGPISTPIGLAAPAGLSVFATDARNFFGFIQALASEGKVDVLSNPHIIVKNYGKATITVGSDEPIATQSTQTAVTGTASLIQSIEYRRTGIILTVSPQITDGGLVAMTIRQEISNISTSRVVGDGTFPSFTKREAETSVVGRDQEPIVIGGLIDSTKNKTVSGIPILSKIPLLGKLFSFTSYTTKRTELVILITPKVIDDSDEALAMTGEMREKLKGLQEILGDAMAN